MMGRRYRDGYRESRPGADAAQWPSGAPEKTIVPASGKWSAANPRQSPRIAPGAHRQRGMGLYGGILIVALVAALSGGVWAFWLHYTGMIADLAKTEDALHTATLAYDAQVKDTEALKADTARTAALLARRTQTANQAQQEADRYAQLLNDARRDPAAVQWLDAPVPRSVWCGLRQRPAGVVCDQNGKGAPAANPADRDPKPHAERGQRLRLDAVLASARTRSDELQRRQIELAGVGRDAD